MDFCLYVGGNVTATTERNRKLTVGSYQYSRKFLEDMPENDRLVLNIYQFVVDGRPLRGLYVSTEQYAEGDGVVTRSYTHQLRDTTNIKNELRVANQLGYLTAIENLEKLQVQSLGGASDLELIKTCKDLAEAQVKATDALVDLVADEGTATTAREAVYQGWPTPETLTITLEHSKRLKKAEVDAHRLELTGTSVEYDFGAPIGTESFQIRDDRDFLNIMMSAQEAVWQCYLGNGATTDIQFRMASNEIIDIPAEDFAAACSSIYSTLQPYFLAAFSHKDQIDALGAIPAVNAYNITTGWPS